MTVSKEHANLLALRWRISKAIRNKAGFLNEQFSEQLAGAVLEELQAEFGGDYAYIPAHDKEARNDAIRREFNGRNREELCERYGVSRTVFYRIVAEEKNRSRQNESLAAS